jgi:transcriptional regulator with XRE-family HTH domain
VEAPQSVRRLSADTIGGTKSGRAVTTPWRPFVVSGACRVGCSSGDGGFVSWFEARYRAIAMATNGGRSMLVQTLRLKKGWTQEQLALVAGLSVRTVQRIERGETASAESLKALAAAFDVDFLDLKEPDMTDTTILPTAAAAPFDADLLLAFDHVRRKRRFQMGLLAWAVVIPVLFAVNFVTGTNHLWAVWPALFWGLGLLVAWLRIAGVSPWGVAWEKREVERRLGRPL